MQPQTGERATYVIVFTTFPAAEFPGERVLECYRLRWQVELVFKRFKSLAQLGHLPSARSSPRTRSPGCSRNGTRSLKH